MDYLDLILNNQYFHLAAVIAIVGGFIYVTVLYRSLKKAINRR
jgi:hypothetical protein